MSIVIARRLFLRRRVLHFKPSGKFQVSVIRAFSLKRHASVYRQPILRNCRQYSHGNVNHAISSPGLPKPVLDYIDARNDAIRDIPPDDSKAIVAAWRQVERANPLEHAFWLASRPVPTAAELESGTIEYLDDLKSIELYLDLPELKPDVPWGLVIYRTAYADQEAWQRIITDIQDEVTKYADDRCLQNGIFKRHHLQIFDNQAQFEGATRQQLRQHFTNWAETELRRLLREDADPEIINFQPAQENDNPLRWAGPRYSTFLFVDEVCLESVHQKGGRYSTGSPLIKLVHRQETEKDDYFALDVDDRPDELKSQDNIVWDGGMSANAEEDVGWYYIDSMDYIGKIELLGCSEWWEEYRRPEIRGWRKKSNQRQP